MKTNFSTISEQTINGLQFIKAYRQFENTPLGAGHATIIRMMGGKDASHVCDQWRWKKRGFGQFFLNLDNYLRIAFLELWGIKDAAFAPYLKRCKDDPMAMLFAAKPPALVAMQDILLFFENHGMNEHPVPEITLHYLPDDNEKRYGNSSNWADYILGLSIRNQVRIIMDILTYYANKRTEREAVKS